MKEQRIFLGAIGVDSGQMMLCDPCYIESSWEKSEFDDLAQEEMQKKQEFDFSYNGACAASLEKIEDGYSHGNLLEGGLGAVCSAGYGDGLYEVWLTISDEGNWGRRVKKMEIIFIED